jgi:hypothetical protein
MAEMDQAPVDGRTIMSINQVVWDNEIVVTLELVTTAVTAASAGVIRQWLLCVGQY